MNKFIELMIDRILSVKGLPWKALAFVLGMSFVLAAVASSFFSPWLAPSKEELLNLNRSRNLKFSRNASSAQVKSQNYSKIRRDILGRNIFNVEGKVADEDSIDSKEDSGSVGGDDVVVKSTLPFKLVGTIYGGDPLSGLAVVVDKSKRKVQNSFLVGDIMASGVTLLEVYRERIIMKVGERKEYIELERSEIKFAKQRKAGSRYVARAKSRKKQGVPEEYREKGFERTGQRILISKEFKKNLIENNLSKVLQDAKAVPSVNMMVSLMALSSRI